MILPELPSDGPRLVSARFLVKAEMYPPENARVIHVVGDLFPTRVMKNYGGQSWIAKRDEKPSFQYSRSKTARAAPPALACAEG